MRGPGGLGHGSLATGVQLDKDGGWPIAAGAPAAEGIVGPPGRINLPSNEMGGKSMDSVTSQWLGPQTQNGQV